MTDAAKDSRNRILIVDDNRMGLVVRKHVLEEAGHEVFIVVNANEALERFGLQDFDLVITDFRMPQLNGIELIQAMRRLKPNVPMVLISGFTDALGLDEGTTGADAVLQKNHTEVSQLVRVVNRLLRKTPKKPPRKEPPPDTGAVPRSR